MHTDPNRSTDADAIRIEPAGVEDAPAIAEVQHRAFRTEAERYGNPEILPLRETANEIAALFGPWLFFKAVEAGRIVGAVRARVEGDVCEVGRLSVPPEYRRRGIGRRLMLTLETALPGVHRFRLFTAELSTNNVALYERAGYHRTGEATEVDGVRLIYLEKIRS